MTDLLKAADSPNMQDQSADALRKVVQIFAVIWSVLSILSMVSAFVSPGGMLIISGLPTGASAFFGVVIILWAVHALKASARVVVLCAGIMMIVIMLWNIFSSSGWFRAQWAATYGFSLPGQLMILVSFLPGLLMLLGIVLFAGGLLLGKASRSVWGWVAGIAALLALVPVVAYLFLNNTQAYNYMVAVPLLMAISTFCIAISLKRPKPVVELPSVQEDEGH